MSQFRLPGDYYVSQFGGDDLNAGTDPTAPKETISGLPTTLTGNDLVIVGSGTYKGVGTGIKNLEADGEVMIDFQDLPLTTSYLRFVGLRIKNVGGGDSFLTPRFSQCIFETDTYASLFRTTDLNYDRGIFDSVFLANFRSRATTASRIRTTFNSFFGSICNADNSEGSVIWIETMRHNFFSSNTTLYLLQTAIDNVNKEWINNCINGPIKVGSTTYELKKTLEGTDRSDVNGSLPDIIAVWPDVYTDGNFASTNTIIFDEAYRICSPDSDLLKVEGDLGFIGGFKAGKYITIEDENFTTTYDNIEEISPGVFRIESGQDYGKIRMTGKVSDNLISLQKLNLRIPISFDADEIGGSVLNDNVPDAWNGLLGSDTLGDLPQRLRFELRTSQLANANRTNPTDWDNGFIGNTGQFYLMEYGKPITFHILSSVVYGNADKFAINPDTILPFFYRSWDLIITITNTRVKP